MSAVLPVTTLDFSKESRRSLLIGVETLLLTITYIIVGLRFYARFFVVRCVGADDWLILVSLVLATALTTGCLLSTNYGWTFHVWDVPMTANLFIIAWATQLIFTAAVSMVKISILVFYLRLSNAKIFRRVLYVAITFVSIWVVIFEVLIALACDTPGDPIIGPNGERSKHCIPIVPAVRAHGITNIITDFIVLIIPIPTLWKVQISASRKVGLISVFAVGGIVCICGTVRLVYSVLAAESLDSTWDGFDLWIWTTLEVYLGIICASVPAIKVLVHRLFPALLDSSIYSSTHLSNPRYAYKANSLSHVLKPGHTIRVSTASKGPRRKSRLDTARYNMESLEMSVESASENKSRERLECDRGWV